MKTMKLLDLFDFQYQIFALSVNTDIIYIIELIYLERIRGKTDPSLCMPSKATFDPVMDSIINFIILKIHKGSGILSRLTA
jgi:hypothetical protein